MVGAGLNAGPRHQRRPGVYNNLKRKYPVDVRHTKYLELRNVAALTSALFRSRMPQEVVNSVFAPTEGAGLPPFHSDDLSAAGK